MYMQRLTRVPDSDRLNFHISPSEQPAQYKRTAAVHPDGNLRKFSAVSRLNFPISPSDQPAQYKRTAAVSSDGNLRKFSTVSRLNF